MALFSECMQSCAQRVLDTADIVRDRDISPVKVLPGFALLLLAINANQDVILVTDRTCSFV